MKLKFSSTEALFVAFSESYPLTFSLTAHIRGKFSVEQLKEALNKVKQKHLFFSARVIPTAEGWWYETEGVPDFPIHWAEGDWAAAAAEDLTQKFVNEVGPLTRFIVNIAEAHTDLTAVFHHGIADGLSGAFILRDILHYLGNPDAPIEPIPQVPPIDDLLPPYNGPEFDFAQPSPRTYLPKKVKDSDPENKLYVMPWSLTEAQTDALAKRCRQEKTSVHAALSVAFLVAHDRLGIGVSGSALHKVSSPINLRDRYVVPVGEHLGNYINPGVQTALDCAVSRDFWEMSREVKDSLARDSGDDNLFRQFHFRRERNRRFSLEEILKSESSEPSVDYDLSITNLGNLNFPVEYGLFRLEAIYGPAVNALEAEKVIGVATTAGVLTFTLVTRPRVMDQSTAEKLKNLTTKLLGEAIGW